MSSTKKRRLPAAALGAALAAAAVAASATAASAQAATKAIELAPHRAVYEITLAQSRGGSGVTDLSGRMVYELTGNACEGYAQSMRFVTRMASQDGAPTLTDLRTSSHEDAGARKLRFSSSQYRDDKLAEQTAGDAERTPDALKVELTRPDKKALSLKPGALFPIEHSIALLAAARGGKSIFTADLYDGSEKGEKVYATTAAIGRRHEPGFNKSLPEAKNAASLNALPAWPVSLSYFEIGKDQADATPNYELAFLFFENGVSRRLYIDYGEFAIRGQLKELVMLEAAKCDKPPR